jgi:two-component system invasion response regulator UvrY
VDILMEETDIESCGEASDVAGLLEQLPMNDWNVVVLDISLPDRSGLDALIELKEKYPDLPVLILSMLPEDQFAARALQAGAAGYISKQNAPDELVRAIRRVLSGKKYVSDALNEKILNSLGIGAPQPPHAILSNSQGDRRRAVPQRKDHRHLQGANTRENEHEEQYGVRQVRR